MLEKKLQRYHNWGHLHPQTQQDWELRILLLLNHLFFGNVVQKEDKIEN